MGQGRSIQIMDSEALKRAGTVRNGLKEIVTSATFIHDLVEFWIAGVVGLGLFASLFVFVVHGDMPWECEEHIKLVSGAANLGFNQNHTVGSPTASHYECEYMTSTAAFSIGGMCPDAACDTTIKNTICNAHSESLGCKWYEKDDIVSVDGLADPQRNWQNCAVGTAVISGEGALAEAPCCIYNAPTTDDQLHDVCYSIDQYVNDEHYPNFVGKYKTTVETARTLAIWGYAMGFGALIMRVLYHIPILTNWMGSEIFQSKRDMYVRLFDLAFLIVAFGTTIATFTSLDDVLMDNRKHLWGTGGVFKVKAHQDAVEEQLVRGTGFYVVAVYATFLGINVVWFIGTQLGIIPAHPTHAKPDIQARGLFFRSEHA